MERERAAGEEAVEEEAVEGGSGCGLGAVDERGVAILMMASSPSAATLSSSSAQTNSTEGVSFLRLGTRAAVASGGGSAAQCEAVQLLTCIGVVLVAVVGW